MQPLQHVQIVPVSWARGLVTNSSNGREYMALHAICYVVF